MNIYFLFLNIFILFISTKQQGTRAIYLYFDYFEHFTRRFPSHICCYEGKDLPTCSNCPIGFNLYIEYAKSYFGYTTARRDRTEIGASYWYIKDNAMVPCINISVYTYETYSDETIDVWRIKCLNLQPYEIYNVTRELGIFKNMIAQFSVWYECDGYAGDNCAKPCVKNSRSFCDKNGDLKCKDGFINPPECTLDSPCSVSNPCMNSGVCEAISTSDYICNCPPTYTGKNCENLKCDSNICAGKCENGECICTADQIDKTCTTYECGGNYLCKNGGTCGKINSEIFCVCPSGTTGTYCQYNCNPSCVHGKCRKNDLGQDFCECDFGFAGKSCDEQQPNINPSDSSVSTKNALSSGVIAGIVIAVLILASAIAIGGYFIYDKYHDEIIGLITKNSRTKTEENSDLHFNTTT